MFVEIEARILIFPGTDFHFPSTSVPPGTFFRLCNESVRCIGTYDAVGKERVERVGKLVERRSVGRTELPAV